MREKDAATRRLPLERITQRRGIDGEQNDVGLPGAVFARAAGQLLRRGEVDETVLPVLRGTGIGASRPGIFPLVLAAQVEDEPAIERARLISSAW